MEISLLSTIIDLFLKAKQIGLNIVALLGAYLFTYLIIRYTSFFFNKTKERQKIFKHLKTDVPILVSFIICIVLGILMQTSVAMIVIESIVTAFVAMASYEWLKRKVEWFYTKITGGDNGKK